MRILVVEDEARLAALLRRGLQEDGYAVDVTGEGSEALWLASQQQYDAVTLDIMLPDQDGLQVCKALRAADCWAPILMLTARDELDARVSGLDSGADDYLVKPFDFDELTARLRALIRRGAPTRPAILIVGDLRLDPACHAAWRGDIQLALTPKELALLELFMRRVGEVVTRSDILDHVWDFAYDGLSNVVDQYVSYLRRKIDKPFDRSDLETIRGVGYRLRPDPSSAE